MAFYYVTSAHNRYGKSVPVDVSDTYLAGQVVQWDLTTGFVDPSDASTTFTEAEFVTVEPYPNATNPAQPVGFVQAWKIDSNNQFICDTVNDTSATMNGQRMILDSTGTLANNTGTDSSVGVFRQTGIIGPAANRQIIGEFVSK